MNKPLFVFLSLIISLSFLGTTTSCKAKYGCPSNEEVKPLESKKRIFGAKRNKNHSELFDKKTRKKMKH